MKKLDELFVALIPDGGRRYVNHDIEQYARSYQEGADVVGDILKACVLDERVRIFAAWGLSDDNASGRTPAELEILNGVFHMYLEKLRSDLDEDPYRGVKVVHIGDHHLINPEVFERIHDITSHTSDRCDKYFGLCLGHGGKEEMERAIRIAHGARPMRPWRDYLDLPSRGNIKYQDVDLIVRTGTDPLEPYTSNYLAGYRGPGTQERFFAEKLPEFTVGAFMAKIDEITRVEQRQGA